MFEPGSRVGDFEILGPLRTGGMATLFVGRRIGAAGFERPVAVKVVHSHLAEDPDFIKMFVDEALLSARIHHPNVVHVEHLGELDGKYYLVMELVDGCSLAQLRASLGSLGRRLAPAMAAHVALQIASGLHAAHEATGPDGSLLGVVHRDVSPSNVLVSRAGHVKLIDFGVAQLAAGASSGTLAGKLGYMAPEQAWGEVVDRRTDVYALGVVLWEMLTGRKMLRAENKEALLRLTQSPRMRPPSAYANDVPAELDEVVMKSLARNSGDRFATAHEMRTAIVRACPSATTVEDGDVARLVAAALDAEPSPLLDMLPELEASTSPAEREQCIRTWTVDVTLAPDVPIPGLDEMLEPWEREVDLPRRDTKRAARPARGLVWLVAVAAVVGIAAASWVALAPAGGPVEAAPNARRGAAAPSNEQVVDLPVDLPVDPTTTVEPTPVPAAAEARTETSDSAAVTVPAPPSETPRRVSRASRRETATRSRERREDSARGMQPVKLVDGVPIAPMPF